MVTRVWPGPLQFAVRKFLLKVAVQSDTNQRCEITEGSWTVDGINRCWSVSEKYWPWRSGIMDSAFLPSGVHVVYTVTLSCHHWWLNYSACYVHCSRDSMLLRGRTVPKNGPFPWGISTPSNDSLSPHESATKLPFDWFILSITVHPFS